MVDIATDERGRLVLADTDGERTVSFVLEPKSRKCADLADRCVVSWLRTQRSSLKDVIRFVIVFGEPRGRANRREGEKDESDGVYESEE